MSSLLAVLFNGLLFFSTTSSVHTAETANVERNVLPVANNMVLNFVDLCSVPCTDCASNLQVDIIINEHSEIVIVSVAGTEGAAVSPTLQNNIKQWMMSANTCFENDTTYSIYVSLLNAPLMPG